MDSIEKGKKEKPEEHVVDWSAPVLVWKDIVTLIGGAEAVVKKECRKLVPSGICFKRYDGTFIAHREKFVEYIGSGRRITDEEEGA